MDNKDAKGKEKQGTEETGIWQRARMSRASRVYSNPDAVTKTEQIPPRDGQSEQAISVSQTFTPTLPKKDDKRGSLFGGGGGKDQPDEVEMPWKELLEMSLDPSRRGTKPFTCSSVWFFFICRLSKQLGTEIDTTRVFLIALQYFATPLDLLQELYDR